MSNKEKMTYCGVCVAVLLAILAVLGIVNFNEWSKHQAELEAKRRSTQVSAEKIARRLVGDVDDNNHSLRRPGEGVEFTLPDKDVWGHNFTALYGKHLTQETVEIRSFGANGLEGDDDDITATESQLNFGGATAVGSNAVKTFTTKSIEGTAEGVGNAVEGIGSRIGRWWSGDKKEVKEAPKPKGESR